MAIYINPPLTAFDEYAKSDKIHFIEQWLAQSNGTLVWCQITKRLAKDKIAVVNGKFILHASINVVYAGEWVHPKIWLFPPGRAKPPAEPHHSPDVCAAQPEASPYLSRSCISAAVSGCAPGEFSRA
jgi:hypothetical protein